MNYAMITVECFYCDGQGWNYSDNGPSPSKFQCSECQGNREITIEAEDYYNHACKEIKRSRNRYHTMCGTISAGRYHEQARAWVDEAKKARALLLTHQWAGSGYILNANR